MAFDTQAAIIAQNSATAAATITAALIASGEVGVESAPAVFDSVRRDIFAGTIALANDTETGAPAVQRGGGRSFSGGQRGKTDPGGVTFKEGTKHAGKTVAEVYAEAPDYIQWTAENSKNEFMRRVTSEYLETVAA